LDAACPKSPSGGIYRWEFERYSEVVTIDGEGPLTLDEPNLMLVAARAGVDLAYLSEWNVGADLTAGTLIRVLEEWTPPFLGLRLYYPGRRRVPAGLRALIDLISEQRRSDAP
jgi:DNA-binding transcriptional LysR family regulator